jgi:bifunctional UDP-N-acetylglucosamine pyrophosphorylase/glucosamine-1-phosphate N-acetyltransferase
MAITMKTNEAPSAGGVIILAAGMGKRMKSALPKVLHEIAGKPLIFHVLNQVREVSPDSPVAIVVGHGREKVEAFVRAEPAFRDMKISFILQAEQKGTGHAARCVMDSEWGTERVRQKSTVLVLPGDLPLISAQLVREIFAPLRKSEVLRVLTCELSDPQGYGRIIRKGKRGAVLRIVEEKDATPKEKLVREVATSIYLFQSDFLQARLRKLSTQNAQGEYYLTDLVEHASRAAKKIPVLCWPRLEELRGVNDPWELAQAGQFMNQRWVRYWALQGVKFIDPATTYVDVTVKLAEGVVVQPGVILRGATTIQAGAVLKAGSVIEDSQVGAEAQIGPYAHLRPGSHVGRRAKIGNFVELKKSVIGENTSVAHLSYVGDAEVGKNVNIGCGFVTCNFDGRMIDGQRKHKTTIEDEVFLGSDCQAVAPVKIGRGAFVASGSTITEDVPPGDLAIARSRQVNKPGYARKLRQNKEG